MKLVVGVCLDGLGMAAEIFAYQVSAKALACSRGLWSCAAAASSGRATTGIVEKRMLSGVLKIDVRGRSLNYDALQAQVVAGKLSNKVYPKTAGKMNRNLITPNVLMPLRVRDVWFA